MISWAVGFAATWDIYLLIPLLHVKKKGLKSTNTKNKIIAHTYSFCTFNKKKTAPKIGTQGTNPYIFLWYPKSKFKKKFFFEILKSQKIRMPNKVTLKSQAKYKTLFLLYPFLAIV